MTDEEFISYQMKALERLANSPVPEWNPGMNPWTFNWTTETRTIYPKRQKKRWPSTKGYGDYMGRRR
jgi:hypothetical protein